MLYLKRLVVGAWFCLVADLRCSCCSYIFHCCCIAGWSWYFLGSNHGRSHQWSITVVHLMIFYSQVLQSEAYHTANTSSTLLAQHAFTLTKVTEYNDALIYIPWYWIAFTVCGTPIYFQEYHSTIVVYIQTMLESWHVLELFGMFILFLLYTLFTQKVPWYYLVFWTCTVEIQWYTYLDLQCEFHAVWIWSCSIMM